MAFWEQLAAESQVNSVFRNTLDSSNISENDFINDDLLEFAFENSDVSSLLNVNFR